MHYFTCSKLAYTDSPISYKVTGIVTFR